MHKCMCTVWVIMSVCVRTEIHSGQQKLNNNKLNPKLKSMPANQEFFKFYTLKSLDHLNNRPISYLDIINNVEKKMRKILQ